MNSPILRVGEEPKPLRGSPRQRPKQRDPCPRQQSQGRFLTLNTFCDVTMARLTRAELAVWLLLYRDTKPEGTARTSQADLARRAGVDKRTVERAVRRLVAAGLLDVIYQGGFQRGVSVYRVHPQRRLPDTGAG